MKVKKNKEILTSFHFVSSKLFQNKLIRKLFRGLCFCWMRNIFPWINSDSTFYKQKAFDQHLFHETILLCTTGRAFLKMMCIFLECIKYKYCNNVLILENFIRIQNWQIADFMDFYQMLIKQLYGLLWRSDWQKTDKIGESK